MLFRRQNDQATAVSSTTPTASAHSAKALATTTAKTDNIKTDNTIRPAPLTATPTQPIAQAQQRRMITTPAGNFSLPSSSNAASRDGSRKLQVGRDITLNGEIGACDHLAIEGTVTATIKQLQQFDILDYGVFNGSVTTENADINGTFDGDLTVTGRLWLRANAKVSGSIKYAALQVEKGAALRGTVDVIPGTVTTTPTTTFSAETLAAANDTVSE